jgi:hypothetical protein
MAHPGQRTLALSPGNVRQHLSRGGPEVCPLNGSTHTRVGSYKLR